MQSFQVQSSFEIAPMSVHLSSADLYLQDLEDVLISQPDWDEVSSTVQDDDLYTLYGNYAQVGDIGNALLQDLQWSEEVSSTLQEDDLYTLYGENYAQVGDVGGENALPQDLQWNEGNPTRMISTPYTEKTTRK